MCSHSSGNEDSDDDEPANTPTGEEKSQDFHNQIDEKRNKLKENDITHIINCHTGDYANRANPRPNLITLLKRVKNDTFYLHYYREKLMNLDQTL